MSYVILQNEDLDELAQEAYSAYMSGMSFGNTKTTAFHKLPPAAQGQWRRVVAKIANQVADLADLDLTVTEDD